MTFTKENASKFGKQSGAARIKNKDDWFAFLASGGLRKYNELMDKLAEDEPIGENQKQFMDRSERSFPYIKARKTDITSDDKPLEAVLVQFVDNENN